MPTHPKLGSLKPRDLRLLADRIEEGHYSTHDALNALRACATRISVLESLLRRSRLKVQRFVRMEVRK